MIRFLINRLNWMICRLERLDDLPDRTKEKLFGRIYLAVSYIVGYFLFSWALTHCKPDEHTPDAPRMVMTLLWLFSPITVPLTVFILLVIGIFVTLSALL